MLGGGGVAPADREQGTVEAGAEALGQQVVGPAAGGRCRVVARIGETEAHAEGRGGQGREGHDGGRQGGQRVPLHGGGQPPPAPALFPALGLRLGGAREYVSLDAVAEEREEGGQQGQRGGHGDQNGQRYGNGHPLEGTKAQGDQAEQGDDDGAPDEEDRTARGVQGGSGGGLPVRAVGELVPVAVEDQQRVVDADTEADQHHDRRSEVGDGEDVGGQRDQADRAADRRAR